MIDFTFTEKQKMFRKAAHELAAKSCFKLTGFEARCTNIYSVSAHGKDYC